MRFKKVYIEITNKCNLSCSFCSKDKIPRREMTVEEFEHIIKEVKEYTNYIYLHVKGEPLFHSNLKEILDLCEIYNINVNITTNGTLLNIQKDLIINCNKIRQLNISLHSFENNVKDDKINEIFNAVDDILKIRKMSIVYRFWALNNKEFSMENKYIISKLIERYNIDQEKQKEINVLNNINIKENLYINKASRFIWPSLDQEEKGTEGHCLGLKTHIAILSSGVVVPCCLDSTGVINLGNIFEEPLDIILNKTRTLNMIKSFQNNFLNEELCRKCSYISRCTK